MVTGRKIPTQSTSYVHHSFTYTTYHHNNKQPPNVGNLASPFAVLRSAVPHTVCTSAPLSPPDERQKAFAVSLPNVHHPISLPSSPSISSIAAPASQPVQPARQTARWLFSARARASFDMLCGASVRHVAGFGGIGAGIGGDGTRRVQWLFRQQAAACKVIQAARESNCEQEELVRALFHDSVTQKFPVARAWKAKVAKGLVEMFEENGGEVHEELFDIVVNGLSGSSLESEFSFLTFGFAQRREMEDENFVCAVRVDSGPLRKVGLLPWEAGLILADLAVANPDWFSGKRILELGAGIGVTGIVMDKVCRMRKLTLTDFDQEVLDNLQFNVDANNCTPGIVDVCKLDWTSEEDLCSLGEYDLLLIADCVYAPDLIPPLLHVVKVMLQKNPNKCGALFVSTERNAQTFRTFLEKLEEFGICCSEMSAELPEPGKGHENELFFYENLTTLTYKNIDRTSIRLFFARLYSSDSVVEVLDGSGNDSNATSRFKLHMQTNTPCLIENLDLRPCQEEWVSLHGQNNGTSRPGIDTAVMKEQFQHSQVPVVGNTCPKCRAVRSNLEGSVNNNPETADCTTIPLPEYFDCWEAHGASTAGYLKDWHAFTDSHPKQLYTTPQFFSDDWLNWYFLEATCKEAEQCTSTSDYRFVYCGPGGTMTGLHHDVFRSYSWSANLVGSKLWILFPPEQGKLVGEVPCIGGNLTTFAVNWFRDRCDVFDLDGKVPMPDLELKNFVACAIVETSTQKDGWGDFAKTTPILVIQKAKEAFFVPSGWFHQVINLEDTLSVNHNWFNRHNLSYLDAFFTKELEKTREALDDCKRLDPSTGQWQDGMAREEWDEIVQDVMRLNVAMNWREWIALLEAKLNKTSELDDQDRWAITRYLGRARFTL